MSKELVTLTQAQWDKRIKEDKTRRVNEFTARMHQLAEHYRVNVYAQIQAQGNGSTAIAVVIVEARQ